MVGGRGGGCAHLPRRLEGVNGSEQHAPAGGGAGGRGGLDKQRGLRGVYRQQQQHARVGRRVPEPAQRRLPVQRRSSQV